MEWYKMHCKSLNLTMGKLPKEVLRNESLLQELVKGIHPSPSVWLGGRANNFSDWSFINGVPSNHAHWAPHDFGSWSMCVAIHLTGKNLHHPGHTASTWNCWENKKFICRFDDWKDGPSLYISTIEVNWFEARSRCGNLGCDLLCVNNGEDITDLMKGLHSRQDLYFWVGLTHRLWQWDDGDKILYFNWRNREPNNFGGSCLMMYNDGSWNDVACTAESVPFCQEAATDPHTHTLMEDFRKTDVGSTEAALETHTQTLFENLMTTDFGSTETHNSTLGGLLILMTVIVITLIVYLVHLHHKCQPTGDQTEEHLYCDVIPTISGNVTLSPEIGTATQYSNFDIFEELELWDNPVYGSNINTPMNPMEDFELDNLEETEIEDNPVYGTV